MATPQQPLPTLPPIEPEMTYDPDKYLEGTTPQSPAQLPGSTMEAAGGLLSEQYRPTTEAAAQRNIQPEDTASGQMTKIMDVQNELMRDAQARAKAQMSSRGLLSTSMTAGEVQRGMMDAAMELAKHDASTYLKQGLENQAIQNQFARDYNAYLRDLSAGQFEADIGEYVKDAALRRNIQLGAAETRQKIQLGAAETQQKIQVSDAASMNRLTESLQDYKESLGQRELEGWIASGAEEAIKKAALDGSYIDSYQAIMTNADMTNAEKQIRLDELDVLFADLYDSMGKDFDYMQNFSTGYLAVTDAVMSV